MDLSLTSEQFVIDATEKNFTNVVINESKKRLVLLDISADWCSPCKMLMPVLDKLAKQYEGRFLLAKVDADENMRIAGRYKVKGFPTVITFVQGEEVNRFHGNQRENYIIDFIDNSLF